MNRLVALLVCGSALSSGAASPILTSETALREPATPNTQHSARPTHIVSLRPGVDPENLAKEFKLNSHHVYHHALNGFAAAIDSARVEKLKQDRRVLAVEPDGQIVPCAQTVPTGILRMGITNFPVAHINGQDNRIAVDVAVMDTGIQTNHPDLNVVQAVDFTGGGYNGDDWDGHVTSQSLTPQGFQLSFPAVPGYTYTVQETRSLSQSNQWTPLASTNGAGSLSTATVTDTNPDPVMRLYRLARTPAP